MSKASPDHGDQGTGRLQRLGLHLGQPGTFLRAARLGRNDELAHSSIRFTLGRFTTEQEIDYAVELLKSRVGKLRDMSPLWGNGQGRHRPEYRAVGCALSARALKYVENQYVLQH